MSPPYKDWRRVIDRAERIWNGCEPPGAARDLAGIVLALRDQLREQDSRITALEALLESYR